MKPNPEVIRATAAILGVDPRTLTDAIQRDGLKSYTQKQAAETLQLSTSTITRMIRSGDLPHFRAGKRGIRIPVEAIDKIREVVQ